MNDNSSNCSSGACACAPGATETAEVKVQPQWQSRKTEEGAVVEIALPGVAKDGLELTTGNGFFKLNATRKAPEGSKVVQGGAAPGGYRLDLKLGANLDGGNASAKFEDGVLTVALPFAESAKPRRIEVA